jgi:hypothetical protein
LEGVVIMGTEDQLFDAQDFVDLHRDFRVCDDLRLDPSILQDPLVLAITLDVL